jgi:hypothetical protein
LGRPLRSSTLTNSSTLTDICGDSKLVSLLNSMLFCSDWTWIPAGTNETVGKDEMPRCEQRGEVQVSTSITVLYLIFAFIHWHNYHLSRVVSEAIKKMDGKYLDIATSHVTARVLQVSWAHTVFVNVLHFLLCCLCPGFWWSVDHRLLADMCKVVLAVREGCYFWYSTSTFARSFSQEICGFPCKEACRTRYISYNFIYGSDHVWACGYVRMLHDSLIWPLASLTCLLFAVAASKKQFASFISSLHGHVAKLLHHTIGAAGVCVQLCYCSEWLQTGHFLFSCVPIRNNQFDPPGLFENA